MSEYKMLFNYIKQFFPSTYRVTFGTQEENAPNSIGVFFQGGTPRKKLVQNGEYFERVVSVTFNINAKKEYNAVEECIKMLEDFKEEFDKVHDMSYKEENSTVSILYTECFGDLNMLGFNGVGLPCYSLNYIIHYK